MKKKNTWTSAIPKKKKKKDVLRIMKNPAEFNRMKELLGQATRVTENISKFEKEKFKTVEEIVAFVSVHLSDDFSGREILLEEMNNLVERYEERLLPREGSDQDPAV